MSLSYHNFRHVDNAFDEMRYTEKHMKKLLIGIGITILVLTVQQASAENFLWNTCATCQENPEVAITGDIITVGTAGRSEDTTLPTSIHGASALLPPGIAYTITFEYDLSTWDAYTEVNNKVSYGIGYWDSFSMSVSPRPYWELALQDPLHDTSDIHFGLLWGGTGFGDGILDKNKGTLTVELPAFADATYLNFILDTQTPPDANHNFPSWGTFKLVRVVAKSKPSSVVFLPGLEASKLYRQETFENQLWDPNRSQDLQDLFLNEQGESILPGIYTRDIISAVDLTGSNIYKSFISDMNTLVENGTIKEWKALPYDWRFDLDRIIDTNDMMGEIERMAARSLSGKVTLIAHSNGGLVAKRLIERLENAGKDNLVDKLILVAVPQKGTPKSLEVLLHGEKFGIVKSQVLPRDITRGLAEHAKSVFNLLPTEKYFSTVKSPVIEIDSNAQSTASLFKKYGASITTATTMRNFLQGIDGRSKPLSSDVISPNVLLPSFVANSVTRATQQDAWTPPAGLKIVEVIGWGLETVRGLLYTDREVNTCNESLSECLMKKVIDVRPKTTTDGDNTVITYSADTLDGEKYYVDLAQNNKIFAFRINRDHADILEVNEVRNLLKKVITDDVVTIDSIIKAQKPTDPVTKNRLSVHSPASINLYDIDGNHTGLVLSGAGEFPILEEQISNSTYFELGEGKYVSIPNDQSVTAVIKGTGIGSFILEFETGADGNYTGGKIYNAIPVNSNTVATLDITEAGVSPLKLDIDGNGTVDAIIAQGENLSVASLLDILEYNISLLDLSSRTKKVFTNKITLVRRSTMREEVFNASRRLDMLVAAIQGSLKKKEITFSQAELLMSFINQIKKDIQ